MTKSEPDDSKTAHSTPDPSEIETAATSDSSHSEHTHRGDIPAKIGHYRIIRSIGEGGMGAVYEAEQDSPKRRVALKVIRSDAISERLLKRFEIEAQILGQLDHPGIATIYEAGTFGSGSSSQPFFAMEFVEGTLLTEYAEDQSLGTRERLQLLAKIANAVQHAHQKGVIHRDLKPGNILVTHDGEIKILDFGVARATDADIQSATMQTDIGQLIGTIPYMSPEQASGNPDDLDTRSDVYALGIIAYELLTGQMPYELRQKMIHEAVRVIREDEPKTLSSINRTFRGDVEIIVGKALAKEKDRRYQSASDLGSDIERYLNNEPIEARPPSTWYQLSKFSKRNKAIVVGVAAVLFVSVVGAAISVRFAVGEAEQKKTALLKEQEAKIAQSLAEDNESEAIAQREIAVGINSVFRELVSYASTDDQGASRYGEALLLGEALDILSEQLDSTFKNLPDDVLSAVHDTVGDFLIDAGNPIRAEKHFDRALELTDSEKAGLIEHRETVQLKLAIALFRQGKGEQAYELGAEAIKKYQDRLDELSPELLGALHDFASVLKWSGRNEDAIKLYKDVLEQRRAIDDPMRDLDVAGMEYNLAIAIEKIATTESKTEARAIMIRAVNAREQLLGADHEKTLNAKAELGRMIWTDDLPRAESLIRAALDGMRELRSDRHWRNRQTAVNLALLILTQDRYEEALPILTQALDGYRRWSGPDAASTLTVTRFLIQNLIKSGDNQEADHQVQLARSLIVGDDRLDEKQKHIAIEQIETMDLN